MSRPTLDTAPAELHDYAAVFAALGDETRLSLVARLSREGARSISQLSAGSPLTRQAMTKHLKVLEGAGIVHSRREGRESLFELQAEPFKTIEEYLGFVSRQWDAALARLQAFVER